MDLMETCKVSGSFIIMNALLFPGKLTILSPWLTGFWPIVTGYGLIFLQLIHDAIFFKLFAEGNFILMITNIYTWVQLAMFTLLYLNLDIYLYDLKIIRLISLGWAVFTNVIYLFDAFDAVRLIW